MNKISKAIGKVKIEYIKDDGNIEFVSESYNHVFLDRLQCINLYTLLGSGGIQMLLTSKYKNDKNR